MNKIGIILLLFLYSSCTNNNFKNSSYGVIRPTGQQIEEWNLKYDKTEPNPNVENWDWDITTKFKFPPPGNQKNEANCTAWALSYIIKSFQEAQDYRYSLYDSTGKLDSSKVFSPAYHFSKIKNPLTDNLKCKKGVLLYDAIKVLETSGTISLKDEALITNSSDCDSYNLTEDCTDICYKNRINTFRSLMKPGGILRSSKVNLSLLKLHIRNSQPIVISIELDEKWSNGTLCPKQSTPPFIWNKFGKTNGNSSLHAVVLVGYHSSKGFKIINSQGSKWCENGYLWISEKIIEEKTAEAYVLDDYNNHLESTIEEILEGNPSIAQNKVIKKNEISAQIKFDSLNSYAIIEDYIIVSYKNKLSGQPNLNYDLYSNQNGHLQKETSFILNNNASNFSYSNDSISIAFSVDFTSINWGRLKMPSLFVNVSSK